MEGWVGDHQLFGAGGEWVVREGFRVELISVLSLHKGVTQWLYSDY